MVVWYSLLGSVHVWAQPFAGLANEEVLGIVSYGRRDPCARDSDLRCILPL